MSGIVGIWNLSGQPVSRPLLASLSARLAHRGPDAEAAWISGPVGLAARLLRVTPESLLETQPALHRSGVALVFDGRLDNRDELLALCRSTGIHGASPDPLLVLAAYERFGERFVEHLAGDFAVGLFDPHQQRLLLARDPIGMRPLYYCQAGDTFLFGSEIKALLAHPNVSTEPNDELLGGFLIDGLPEADGAGETFFKGIHGVPPAHVVIVSAKATHRRRYWDFDPSHRIRLGSFDEYAEAFRHLFEEAVRRRMRSASPVAVSISGGLDSSAILCTALRLRRHTTAACPDVVGVSYSSSDGSACDEQRFLTAIEHAYGISIRRLPGLTGMVEGSRQALWHVEAPMLDAQWSGTQAFLEGVRGQGLRVLLTGHWGDQVLHDQAYLIDLVRRGAWVTVAQHLREYSRWCPDVRPGTFMRRFVIALLKYHLPSATLPWLRRVRTRLASTSSAPWAGARLRRPAWNRRPPGARPGGWARRAHFASLYDQARAAQHVLIMEWNDKVAAMHGMELAFPYLDRDLLTFLLAIPGEMQTYGGVPKAILRRAMHGTYPTAIEHRAGKADFTHVVNQGVKRDLHALTQIVQGGLAVTRGYVDQDRLNNILSDAPARLDRPDCLTAWSLDAVLALEQWLQAFWGPVPAATAESRQPRETVIIGGTS